MNYKDEQKKFRELAAPKVVPPEKYDEHDKRFASKFAVFNRASTRKKMVDRTFTKKGFHFGIRIGGRQYNKMHHLAKIQSPTKSEASQ